MPKPSPFDDKLDRRCISFREEDIRWMNEQRKIGRLSLSHVIRQCIDFKRAALEQEAENQ